MLKNEIMLALAKVREVSPLVHQITNYVTVNDCANITLAVGASPVMAQDLCEVAEMVAHAKALVLNIGTLQSDTVEAMFVAAARAKELSIPVIFDPVGVGATKYRTTVARRILREIAPDIIRCNMGELKVLCGLDAAVKGVDSADDGQGGEIAAKELALKIGGVVAVTGKVDIVTDGRRMAKISNGDIMLTRVTGTGCMTSALVGCFAAVGDPFIGAVAGVASMGIAGEIAVQSLQDSDGIGTFRMRIFDVISKLDSAALAANLQVAEVGDTVCQ